MKIFLVGATGRVGSEFIKLALAANHQITAFVRDPKKLSVKNPGLTLQTGDLKDIFGSLGVAVIWPYMVVSMQTRSNLPSPNKYAGTNASG